MGQHDFMAFRRSQQRRLTAVEFAEQALEDHVQVGFTGIKAFEITDWDRDVPDKDDFLVLLVGEYEAKFADWALVIRSSMTKGIRQHPKLELCRSLTVHAKIQMNSPGWLGCLMRRRPVISVHLGLILAIEDLIGFCLCTKTFFTNRTEDGEPTLDILSYKIGEEHKSRFVDYEPMLARKKGQAQAATTAIPFSPWRLHQLDLISDFSVLWAILHESAHHYLAHLNEVRKLSRFPAKRFTRKHRASDAAANRRRVLEMEADAFAAFVLYDMAMSKSGTDTCSRYTEAIAAQGLPKNRSESVVDADAIGSRLRLLLLAMGLVVILLEHKRWVAAQGRLGGEHPSPVTRLFGIFFSVGIKFLNVDENGEASPYTREELHTLFSAYMDAVVDLQMAILMADIPNEVFRPFIWEQQDKRKAPFTIDLFNMISRGIYKPNQLQTDAAREFVRLRMLSDPGFFERR
jgi:hypothetical protein